MNNNRLPQEYKENFLNKIKRFFAKFFYRKVKPVVVDNEQKENNEIKNEFKQSLINEQAIKTNNEMVMKKSIVDIIDEKPELIETLSNDNLKKLIKLYDEIINENNIKIERLRKRV